MPLELGIRAELTAADATGVGLIGDNEALALQTVEVPSLAAVFDDPLREMKEGVAVRVGGDLDDVAEDLGHAPERDYGIVGLASRGLVVKVPENNDVLLTGRPRPVAASDHLNVGVGRWNGGGRGGDGAGSGVGGREREREGLERKKKSNAAAERRFRIEWADGEERKRRVLSACRDGIHGFERGEGRRRLLPLIPPR